MTPENLRLYLRSYNEICERKIYNDNSTKVHVILVCLKYKQI